MIDRYAGAAAGWARGAALVYGPLAAQLVGAAPHPLAGRRVLDAGAGTGLVSAALSGVGAHPVAVDASVDMLAWDAAARPPSVAGTITALPLRDGSVDDAVAAFVLNHTDDPVRGLRELARVTRPGGAVLVTVASTASASPARDRVDVVAAAHGFRAPSWYAELRTAQAPLLGDARAMTVAGREAGLEVLDVDEYDADVGVRRAGDLVDYRLGQAHYAAWLDDLGVRGREVVRAAAIASVAPVMEPYRPRVVRMCARCAPRT